MWGNYREPPLHHTPLRGKLYFNMFFLNVSHTGPIYYKHSQCITFAQKLDVLGIGESDTRFKKRFDR